MVLLWHCCEIAVCDAVDYTGLHKAIKEWDFSKLEELKEHQMLLERIEPSITKLIKPGELLTHMNDCLKLRECEEIKAVSLPLWLRWCEVHYIHDQTNVLDR